MASVDPSVNDFVQQMQLRRMLGLASGNPLQPYSQQPPMTQTGGGPTSVPGLGPAYAYPARQAAVAKMLAARQAQANSGPMGLLTALQGQGQQGAPPTRATSTDPYFNAQYGGFDVGLLDPSERAQIDPRMAGQVFSHRVAQPGAAQQPVPQLPGPSDAMQRGGSDQLMQALTARMPDERGATRFTNDYGTEEMRGPSQKAWPAWLAHAKAATEGSESLAKAENLRSDAAKNRFAMLPAMAAQKAYNDSIAAGQPHAVAEQSRQSAFDFLTQQLAGKQQASTPNGEESEFRDAIAKRDSAFADKAVVATGITPNSSPEEIGKTLLQRLTTPGAMDDTTLRKIQDGVRAQAASQPDVFGSKAIDSMYSPVGAGIVKMLAESRGPVTQKKLRDKLRELQRKPMQDWQSRQKIPTAMGLLGVGG